MTLLVGSFAGAGIVGGMAGQLAVRGAEIGSALVVKLLSFDLSLLVPICLVAGTDDVPGHRAARLAASSAASSSASACCCCRCN